MVKAALANSLWWLASRASGAAYASALNHPDHAQEQVLRALLRKNSATAFGREHGLHEVSTSAEFGRRVPIRTYDELRPWIDRVRRGESAVLTSEPVSRLVPTSGSTAARKLIPYTAAMHRQLKKAIGPWIFDLYRSHPRALLGSSYWSISPVASDGFESAEDSGVPIGFEEDTEYLGEFHKILADAALAVPPELRFVTSIEDWRYVTALLLLRQADLSLISVWHPSFLILLLREIKEHWNQLLSDIADGTCAVLRRLPLSVAAALKLRPDLRRSRYLQRGTPDTGAQLWPRLTVVSCWADGHARGSAAELAQSLGSVALQPKGLIATEGIVSIPFEGLHPLAICSHYLEFEDDSGRVWLSPELRENHEYNVVLTTGGGLYRYRLDDRIVVDAILGQTPSVRFVGKSSQVSDRMGEKLSDGFVGSVFSKLFQDAGKVPSFAMLAPDVDGDGCRYTLYLSADAPNEMCTKLDLLLSANPHYEYCRRLTQLRSPRLFRVSDDAYARYCRRLQCMGKRLGEIKPVGLSPLDDWSNQLDGHYIE